MIRQGEIVRCNRGTYRFKSILGTGGMSVIWLVEDVNTGNRYAAKLPSGMGTPFDKLLFERELLKSLSHEHVIGYRDDGILGSLPVLIMELAEGTNLEQRGRLDEREAKARAVELLLALDYLHSRNIIHRDVKPKNIIVSSDVNYLKLLDLGTATYFNTAGMREAVISPGGYTAPEQYQFTSSMQADIWSSGAVLFYMLTGRHPSEAMPGYPNVRANPPDPRIFNRDVSEDIADVIGRSMAWDPVERFSSAREMIEAIERGREVRLSRGPVLEVLGQEIVIDAHRLVFGRMTEEVHGTSSESFGGVSPMPRGRVSVTRGGDVIEVRVYDPYKWISRNHFEIFEKNGKWYFKDLGSLNRSAVRSRGELREVWAGYRRESPEYELGERAMIYVAYGSSLNDPPYMVLTFKVR